MIEYIEGAKSIISLIPTVKEYFNKKNWKKIEMWGSWEAFEKSLKEDHSDLRILMEICRSKNEEYNYTKYKKKGIRFFLVEEIGYLKLFKRYFNCYKYYITERTDLSIFGRINLAYMKSKRWITKWQARFEIDKYAKRQEGFNKYAKKKLEEGKIDIIYLYMYENKNITNKKELN